MTKPHHHTRRALIWASALALPLAALAPAFAKPENAPPKQPPKDDPPPPKPEGPAAPNPNPPPGPKKGPDHEPCDGVWVDDPRCNEPEPIEPTPTDK